MNPVPERVFAYVKSEVSESATADFPLAGDNDLLIRPFVGKLFATLAYDAGDHLELLQRRHLVEWRAEEHELFELGVKNLEGFLSGGAARLHAHGAGYAVVAGGNFEASLLLVDSMWSWVCAHLGTGRLLARAPARDILMVSPADDPAGRAELDALLKRTTEMELDHTLTDELLLWDGKAWTVV